MTTAIDTPTRSRGRRLVGPIVAIVIAAVLFVAPFLSVPTFGILPGELNRPGSLQVLAVVLAMCALAVTFDIVFGYTGLLSFGHAMFFTIGGYGFAMTLKLTDLGFGVAVLIGLLASIVSAFVVNAIALRATGVAFSMVTLAVAQLINIMISRNYLGSGGEEGLTLPFQEMPKAFIGVRNTQNVYWLALALLVVVVAIALWVTSTRLGHSWKAVRENELRMKVMGVNTYLTKLSATVIASVLAGACGIVYVIVLGTAEPRISSLLFSLSLIVMVVLGGRGRIWGAVIGAGIYTLLEQRLPTVAALPAISDLPTVLRIPLSEPQLLLGIAFIIFIYALPGGITGGIRSALQKRDARRQAIGLPKTTTK